MLGEAATTAADADALFRRLRATPSIAIGKAAAGRGIYAGPGISIKLSALHPRYRRTQVDRVMAELLPRAARRWRCSPSATISASTSTPRKPTGSSSRSTCSKALCLDPALAGWNGLGFVVQAYGKRCPLVLDCLIDLARRSGHRLMVRLVKGAYWDSEIKQAQIDGLEDFPVFTRKVYTDVSYIACAKKLLGARDASLSAVCHAQRPDAGHDLRNGRPGLSSSASYEFQCLHGMGEPLYDEVVGAAEARPPLPHLCARRHA